MADLPAIADLRAESIRLGQIEAALIGWINALLTLPQRDGARRQQEGSAPAMGAAEIVGVSATLAGDRVGHDGIRERPVILSYQVSVRYNGTMDEASRRAARYAGLTAWLALDASAPPTFVDLGAQVLPSDLSTWAPDPESATQRAVGGAFVVQVVTNIRVAE